MGIFELLKWFIKKALPIGQEKTNDRQMTDTWQPNGNPDKNSIDKVSIDKDSVEKRTFDPWEQKRTPRNEDYAIAGMLRCCNGKAIGTVADDYPRYMNYDFKVHDPIKYHRKMIEQGYMIKGTPDDALNELKVAELKEILKSHNLSATGKKDELVKRICENIDCSTLNLESIYIPSEKGIEHLKKFEYVFTLRNYGITPDQYDAFAPQCHKSSKPNDIIWRLLNERYNAYNLENDFGLARNELHNMALFLKNEDKYVDSLHYFIRVLYYDTSGMGNGGTISKAEDITLAPGIVHQICQLKEYFDEEMIARCYERLSLPHHFLSPEQFKNLLNDIFEDNPLEITKYLK